MVHCGLVVVVMGQALAKARAVHSFHVQDELLGKRSEKLVDQSIKKIVSRVFSVSLPVQVELDHATLGKPGHAAIAHQSLSTLPRSQPQLHQSGVLFGKTSTLQQWAAREQQFAAASRIAVQASSGGLIMPGDPEPPKKGKLIMPGGGATPGGGAGKQVNMPGGPGRDVEVPPQILLGGLKARPAPKVDDATGEQWYLGTYTDGRPHWFDGLLVPKRLAIISKDGFYKLLITGGDTVFYNDTGKHWYELPGEMLDRNGEVLQIRIGEVARVDEWMNRTGTIDGANCVFNFFERLDTEESKVMKGKLIKEGSELHFSDGSVWSRREGMGKLDSPWLIRSASVVNHLEAQGLWTRPEQEESGPTFQMPPL
eukprot:gnl/MRDRNA2_/MRDRNA2_28485_c0_seq1.p1 gnl/MRDRNA2_/MRDRNA2_28485_c0~~gnl/MRDRNA2_/MRDRNA2_28485_c0_seq1.p1  ORF type:complete len:368 (+),score=57.43 gnl/MRDRNA2_/MRDRNA2_28485_c0_seq1:133-1236(+)